MTIDELLDRISSEELTEWRAYAILRQEDAEWEYEKRQMMGG